MENEDGFEKLIIKKAEKIIQMLNEEIQNPKISELIIYLCWRHLSRHVDQIISLETADFMADQYFNSNPEDKDK